MINSAKQFALPFTEQFSLCHIQNSAARNRNPNPNWLKLKWRCVGLSKVIVEDFGNGFNQRLHNVNKALVLILYNSLISTLSDVGFVLSLVFCIWVVFCVVVVGFFCFFELQRRISFRDALRKGKVPGKENLSAISPCFSLAQTGFCAHLCTNPRPDEEGVLS